MRTLPAALSLALPLAWVAAPAAAQSSSSGLDGPQAEPGGEPGQAAPAAARSLAPFAGAAVDDRTLGAAAGRDDPRQVALNEQSAGVSRNTVGDNSVTGEARIDGNAFQNMSGLSIVNVNTGNNVAINAAMTVNISIQPGP